MPELRLGPGLAISNTSRQKYTNDALAPSLLDKSRLLVFLADELTYLIYENLDLSPIQKLVRNLNLLIPHKLAHTLSKEVICRIRIYTPVKMIV